MQLEYSIASLPPPPRPSAPAQARQQLYADGKSAEILAFLAERMLEMNKQKQTEIKGFLGWLESYLGAKV